MGPLGAELFHADVQAVVQTGGRTDMHMTKLIVAFGNFSNASKNLNVSACHILLGHG
jgi:hypothetical protein